VTDQFGREISYLRLSVTDLCNLRCAYCMPAEGVAKKRHAEILSVEEIGELVSAAAALGVRKVRLTGGEPLVRRGIVDICKAVAQTQGIIETCMTTNAVLLPDFAAQLRGAGVSRLNISLDTLNPERYCALTRGGDLASALRGIDAAREYGFAPIKINAVLIDGFNTDEIRELASLSRLADTHVRFIELMPIGDSADFSGGKYVSDGAVLRAMPELEPRGSDGVARLYGFPGASGTVGLISPISSHFCPSCNRVRITSDGQLKPCLHSADEISLRGLHGAALLDAMRAGFFGKPRRHALDTGKISAAARNMNAIGG
jgi:cyclic pyranopterin phosphate synthase